MLSKLVDRFSPPSEVREEHVPYGIEDDDESLDRRAPRTYGAGAATPGALGTAVAVRR